MITEKIALFCEALERPVNREEWCIIFKESGILCMSKSDFLFLIQQLHLENLQKVARAMLIAYKIASKPKSWTWEVDEF